MAKELPYFKFYIGDWFNGDITLETYHIQGLFTNICAYYWSKDCKISLINLHKKFRGSEVEIEGLITSGIIKIEGENVSISFLNEQLTSKEVQKITNRINGAKGGRPIGSKTEAKPIRLNFEAKTKPKRNPNITNIKESKVDNNIITRVEETRSKVDFDIFIQKFNSFAGRNFRVTAKTKSSLLARLKDYSKAEILKAIENAHKDPYHIETNFKHLTPEFILRPDKLDKFLNLVLKSQSIAFNPNHMIPGN